MKWETVQMSLCLEYTPRGNLCFDIKANKSIWLVWTPTH